ncbi:tRNA (adenosine(37)-N6)-threonylcarbamoyltransferase complex ATPase subunit type 1 TsaE [Corynebacterium sp.]|uniref:tRNA (adenosine(37)-N6)-threonylcarbamoyltransferase complex ATPase subunit type 1 TsaE n=1 Tax=Corynebacterium sp. TaxID=1720 RepID=UPI0026DEDDE1|nr:tRNA (adenosine(37)-N6)-threonylcarbamoyltransferase complex ATPase subunit type 1 TsaE [Corynebacterium sp.]MDO5512837.1 tRNA (adenosine(37)-N6)-threonylcarbamoyltransferase complex ATPase subunit type 1 TsaE [Corynebacterium sp.]
MSIPPEGTRELATAADTQAFAAELGRSLRAGDVVILDGPLGAGKTTFTQGLARGLQVKGKVTSPTFVIAREHRSLVGGPTLIHLDAYRLLGEGSSGDPLGELDALDLDTDLADAVVVAEWGGGLVEQIAERYLLVRFDRETAVIRDPSSEARIISWEWVE